MLQGPAQELHRALSELQKSAASYVNVSRLQLALRGLEQGPGNETIRIAVLAYPGSLRRVRELIRVLLADPLKQEEEWERALLEGEDAERPWLIRLNEQVKEQTQIMGPRGGLMTELNVASPVLKGHGIEILAMEADPLSWSQEERSDAGDAILVPSVEAPTSSTGRYTHVTTPTHKALIFGNGIRDLSRASVLPKERDPHVIRTVFNIPKAIEESEDNVPFRIIDLEMASSALASFRQSVDNGLTYEHAWFASGLPALLSWLKEGTVPAPNAIKAPVRHLVSSLLSSATMKISAAEHDAMNATQARQIPSSTLVSLQDASRKWAERAHTELRDELDIAFAGHRWRKLGWWKLFWRVDDVSMIASDILSQRFLREAEQELVFLSGRIAESGIVKHDPLLHPRGWAYKAISETPTGSAIGTVSPPPRLSDVVIKPDTDAAITLPTSPVPWPVNIPSTRIYLAHTTIPRLQALAQTLVLQTLSTTAFATGCSALIYVSSLTAGVYEAGAVAALGTVWALRRMQGKWEAARAYWEGEVREEGRLAVRGVEGVVSGALVKSEAGPPEGHEERKAALSAVERARRALDAVE